MATNQLRRDPTNGRWAIMVMEPTDLADIISPSQEASHPERGRTTCSLCENRESETPPEILAFRPEASKPNGPGWNVRVVPDRNPVLQIHGELNNRGVGLYDVLDGIGAHELVIESPRHGESWVEMSDEHLVRVLEAYRTRITDLKQDTRFRHVLVHKNYGEALGATHDHAYSHIIASPITPLRVKEELTCAKDHFALKERCIFCDVINEELRTEERIVLNEEDFIVFAPFASRLPLEVWVIPKTHETFFEHRSDFLSLSQVLKSILSKISKVLTKPGYTMTMHTGPNVNAGSGRGYWRNIAEDFHWHIEIAPRILGYSSFEAGSGFQINLLPPERGARILRDA